MTVIARSRIRKDLTLRQELENLTGLYLPFDIFILTVIVDI